MITSSFFFFFFFFNDTATTEIYTLSLHDALPIYPARSFEDQGLEARRDWCTELETQHLGAHDHFLRIMNIAEVDLVDDFGGRIAQHAFGADVEDLDDAFCVRGNNREIGTGENCVLQGPRLERSEERRVGKECRSRWSPY